MRKHVFILAFFLAAGLLFAQTHSRTLHRSGVYGQTFELVEYTEGDSCRLLLFMSDNKDTNKSGVRTYDSALPTVYFIWSKWFTSPSEYSGAIEASKQFFDASLNLVSLADMKDICDIAPCCSFVEYETAKSKDGKQYIHIEYVCSDLEKLFEIAGMYNRRSREYVIDTYGSAKSVNTKQGNVVRRDVKVKIDGTSYFYFMTDNYDALCAELQKHNCNLISRGYLKSNPALAQSVRDKMKELGACWSITTSNGSAILNYYTPDEGPYIVHLKTLQMR